MIQSVHRRPGPLEAGVEEAAAFVRRNWRKAACAGLILGTGLGELARHIEPDVELDFDEIPYFPRSTALGHRGRLVCGQLAGVPVVAMDGRCHRYEGYSMAEITLPVRVMSRLEVPLLIASNASGGINPQLRCGQLVVIADHINLMGPSRLLASGGARAASAGDAHRSGPTLSPRPTGPPLYDPQLIEQALEIARDRGFAAQAGVYVAVTGPNYETRAEYRFLRRIGGDVVGMSTVPEVIVARECGLRVLALSTVTNVAQPDAPRVVRAEDVLAASAGAEPHLRTLVCELLARHQNRPSSNRQSLAVHA